MFVADDFRWFDFLSNILHVDYSHVKTLKVIFWHQGVNKEQSNQPHKFK